MALIVPAGTTSTDIATAGTYRSDISDYLLACLMLQPTVLSLLKVGAEFAETTCQWNEDRLNNLFITDTTAGGQTTSSTTLNMSAADVAVLGVGYVLADNANPGLGEQVQVTGFPSTTSATITRAFGGTTAVTHAQNAQWNIVGEPIQENSDLGPDKSRARIAKYNYIQRHEANVNLSSELIVRAKRGYSPGISNELEYQFFNRTAEMLQAWNRAFIYSRPSLGVSGVAGQLGGQYSTMAGLISFLDGTYNTTSTVYDYTAAPISSGGIDTAVNYVNKQLHRNGTLVDWALGGDNFAEDIGKLYANQIRLQQDDNTRGYAASFFRTSLTNELRVLLDGYIQDTAPNGIFILLDSARVRIRPFSEQMYFVLTAPTFRDGDAIRCLSKMSLDFRNTGSDSGQAHALVTKVTF